MAHLAIIITCVISTFAQPTHTPANKATLKKPVTRVQHDQFQMQEILKEGIHEFGAKEQRVRIQKHVG